MKPQKCAWLVYRILPRKPYQNDDPELRFEFEGLYTTEDEACEILSYLNFVADEEEQPPWLWTSIPIKDWELWKARFKPELKLVKE